MSDSQHQPPGPPAPDLDIDGLSDFRPIGTGGFATVYSALEANAGRRVAVKVLAAVDDSGRRRFDRECLTMGTAGEHQHVVTLLRAGHLHRTGQPYLVMEHMAGGSLAHRLAAEGAVPWPEAVEASLAIASALGFTHGRGILHKDVKPGNILVSGAGTVKLTDFGISAIREASGTSQLAYSIHYTAPEIFGGTSDPDAELIIDPRDERSDLYSLAASLYTLGVGRPPFQAPTHVALMRQILLDPVPPTGIPALDGFFTRALAKEPTERPLTAADLTAELLHLRHAVAHLGAPTGPWPSGPAPLVASAAPTGPAPIGPTLAGHDATSVDHTITTVQALVGGEPEGQSNGTGPPSGETPPAMVADSPAPQGQERPGRRRWLVTAAATFAAVAVAAGVAAAVRLSDRGGDDDAASAAPLIDPSHRQQAADPDDDAVLGVTQLPDGRLASVSADGTVIVGDPARPQDAVVWSGYRDTVGEPAGDALYAVTLLDDGRLALAGADGTVQLWDPAHPDEPTTEYTGHRDGVNDPSNDDVYAVIQLADGRVASGGDDGTVQIWDPDQPGSTPDRYTQHHERAGSNDGDAVWSLVELPDGRIASGSADGEVHLWTPGRPGSTAVIYTGHFEAAGDPDDDAVRAIVPLASGLIASGGADGTVRIWNPARTDQTIATFTGHADRATGSDTDSVRTIIQLANGWIASAGMDTAVLLWDPADPAAVIDAYTGHTEQVTALRQLADRRVVSTSDDGTVQVWDPAHAGAGSVN